MKSIRLTLVTGITLFFNTAFAQYDLQFPKNFAANNIKELYVIAHDTTKSYSKEVFKIVEDNWRLSPVKMWQGTLSSLDAGLVAEGNYFLCVNTGSTESTVMRDYKEGGNSTQGLTTTNDYYHLDIMTGAEKKNPKRSAEENLITIGRAELYNRKIGMGGMAWDAGGDFTSELFPNDFCNGTKGNIKNMIQYFNAEIPKGKPVKLLQDQPAATELSNLKTETLYLPNYWYGGKGTMLEGVSANSSDYTRTANYIDKVIKSYTYKIKLVTAQELNDLILSADKNIYYVDYIQSSADKIMSVVNGFNGKVIYSQGTKKSYRIKDGDLESIGKAVQ